MAVTIRKEKPRAANGGKSKKAEVKWTPLAAQKGRR